jgi:hypothetical protein
MRTRGSGGVGGGHRPFSGSARLAGTIPVLSDRTRPPVVSDRSWFKQLGRPAVESGPALGRERCVDRAPHHGMREADPAASW